MKNVICLLICICFILSPRVSTAYSVLTHEAIIDACWEKSILPLLKKKFPAVTPDELKEAHAYVYGGAIMPDMGYYPFGSKLFTNLVHYVRSGDFVEALLNEAHDINEYAFAVGALCHYNADIFGHSIGINQSVPLVYTKLEKKYGHTVTYAEDKISHLRMEFGFDVLQTARGNYASTNYHDFIGFKVSVPVLERAFLKTYGLDIHAVFKNLSMAIGTFKWTVKDFFPIITRAAWAGKKKDIVKANPGLTGRKFIYRMHRAKYYREYGTQDTKPGFFTTVLSGLIRILPKVGPLRALKFKIPGQDAEKLFIKSFDTVVTSYTTALNKLYSGEVWLANKDFDTGERTFPGEYKLADESYAGLLLKLDHKNFEFVQPALKQNLVTFYNQPSTVPLTKKLRKEHTQILSALKNLNATPVSVEHAIN